jgi:succinate-semialdehyde dehydrogenase/glutarate-semialdehyde dehydrogenase
MSVLDLTETARATPCLDVLDPATGAVVGRIPAGSPEAADAAVRAARAAQPRWARTAPAERGAALKAAARRVREHAEELAELQSREGGKRLDDSRAAVAAGIAAIEQYAELGPLHRGHALQGRWEHADLMIHEPRGVIALLVPWTDPVAIACGQIAAALVTGNAVVFKPSEKTPLSAARLVELLDLGGPLQLLHGDARAGRPLAAHAGVDLVIHTGSLYTGREIAEACLDRLGKTLLQLSGKDALIVDADVDAEWAAEQAATGAFAWAGQHGTSIERIYVHRDVADPFVEALVRHAEAYEIGPLIDEDQRDWVHNHVEDACRNGAVLRTGGAVPDGPGCFYPPTVLVGPPADAPVMEQETFGPVAAVRVVNSFDAALEEANRTGYGLGAVVLTRSHAHAQRAWRELAVGTVKVNAVFGGAPGGAAEPRGRSGHGFGYGPELLDEVTQTKAVHLGVAP